jgi:hypothetical protein
MTEPHTVEVIELTAMLRRSDPPTGYFMGLRRCLGEREVDPEAVLLVESFDDDENLVFGVLLNQDGRPVTFDYRYPDVARMDKGEITRWEDISSSWTESPHAPGITAALRLLTAEGH